LILRDNEHARDREVAMGWESQVTSGKQIAI
jgi:hypothetical protein